VILNKQISGKIQRGVTEDASQPDVIGDNWKSAIFVIAVLFIVIVGLYWDTFFYLVGLWNQITTGKVTHGWVVVLLCFMMLWKDRANLVGLVPVADYRVVPLVFVASGIWLASHLIDVRSGQAPALLLVILTLIWASVGSLIFRRLLFPLLFLSLSLPIWTALGPPLQHLTATISHAAIQLTGIPSLREGVLIELPSGIFEVSESCSGVNYLLAALTLAGYYAYTNYSSVRARLAVIAVAAGTAIFGNLLRVFIIIYIGHRTQMQSSLVDDHLTMGWILFGALMFALLWFDEHRTNRLSPKKSLDAPILLNSDSESNVSYPCITILLLLSIAVSVGPAIAYLVSSNQFDLIEIDLRLPEGVHGWRGPTVVNNQWNPLYRGVSGSIKGDYQKNDDSVSLYLGYYVSQGQEHELINDLNSLAGAAMWHIISDQTGVKRGSMRELVLRSEQGHKSLLWYRYEVSGLITTNRYLAKLFQLWGLVIDRTDANVVAILVDLDEDKPAITRAVLRDFVENMGPALKFERLVQGQMR